MIKLGDPDVTGVCQTDQSNPGIFGLAAFFLQGLKCNPTGIALELGREAITYRALFQRARAIGAAIESHQRQGHMRRVGIVASHSIDCYAGVIGILLTGNAYVPLNPSFPAERLSYMIEMARLTLIIAHGSVIECLRDIAVNPFEPLSILVTAAPENPRSFNNGANLVSLEMREDRGHRSFQPRPVNDSDAAYTMFTSGSTGRPKGVEISHANIIAFLTYVLQRYHLTANDRFSQMFELTFDLSLFDMFVSWAVGGTLCVVPPSSRMAPAKFVREKQLTVWFSVPSVGNSFARLKVLRPSVFPSLRLSLFCGEALTLKVAELWAEAAPNSILENLYGPTEATVACAHYRWDKQRSPAECQHGIVPIGEIFPGHYAELVDADGKKVAEGQEGELWIAGPQICHGYLDNQPLTSERFSELPGGRSGLVFYHTGDCVRNNSNGQMLFLGRKDFQIKLHGYRIEIGEIEQCLREAAECETVAVVCEKDADGRPINLIGFIETSCADMEYVAQFCRRRLPTYMIPTKLYALEHIPLNVNKKVDRNRLLSNLKR